MRDNIRFRDENGAAQFVIEVIVLYMHLVDRMAFTRLGPAKRDMFIDRLVVAVLKEIAGGLNKEMSANDFRDALVSTYNHRQVQYSAYKALFAGDGPPKNTLFWEFSKILFGFVDDDNPAIPMSLSILVPSVTVPTLTDVMKVDEALR